MRARRHDVAEACEPLTRTAAPRPAAASVHAAMLALQRKAGNVAVSSMIPDASNTPATWSGTVAQRTIIEESFKKSDAELGEVLTRLNPKDEATNLWVTIDGERLDAVAKAPMGIGSMWPLQSSGGAQHAEQKLVYQLLPSLDLKNKIVVMEINKTPCGGCAKMLSELRETYHETKFDLRMLGMYPGSDQSTATGDQPGAATQPEHVELLERTVGAKLLDLTAIADRLKDDKWKLGNKKSTILHRDRAAAESFVNSVVKSLNESMGKLGNRRDRTQYGSELPRLHTTFTELNDFLRSPVESKHEGGGKWTTEAKYAKGVQPYKIRDKSSLRRDSRPDENPLTVDFPEGTSPAYGETTTNYQETSTQSAAKEMTVDQLMEWNQVKRWYPDLVYQNNKQGAYYVYWSQQGNIWVYAHESLPE